MTSPEESSQADQLANVLAAAMGGAGRVAVVGGDRGLPTASPDLFLAADGLSDSALDGCEILAAVLEGPTLERAAALARTAGRNYVFVLAPSAEGAEDALRAAGLALASADRLLFRSRGDVAPPAGSRAERLEAETEAVLLHCVLADQPDAIAQLTDVVARLRAELDVRAQLELDHAATREVERARADRLRELEGTFERIPGIPLLPELERLRSEIEAMRATRIWRLGTAWWRLRDRILRR